MINIGMNYDENDGANEHKSLLVWKVVVKEKTDASTRGSKIWTQIIDDWEYAMSCKDKEIKALKRLLFVDKGKDEVH
jgi:hypothetical protein